MIEEFFPENTKNLRRKQFEYFEYESDFDQIIDIIRNKENTLDNLVGYSKKYYYNVVDLIYYILPPNQKYLSTSFNPKVELLDKIQDAKIKYVICKPKIRIIEFYDYDSIRERIAAYILDWALENHKSLKSGIAEPIYEDFLENSHLPALKFSKIEDILLEIVEKNESIRENLKQQNEMIINKLKDIKIFDWMETYEYHFNFNSYQHLLFSSENLTEIENQFEEIVYPSAIKLIDNITGTAADYIWELISKESENVVKKNSAKFKHLKVGVENLKILKLVGTKFLLEAENNVHNNMRMFEKAIEDLSGSTNLLNFCYAFRLNECGMSIYNSILYLFYLYQRSKIRFYDLNNNQIDMFSRDGQKVILGSTNYFLMSLVNKSGKFDKVKLFNQQKWEFIMDFLIKLEQNKIVDISKEYDNRTPIDLAALKMSASVERDNRLFEILRNHISFQTLNSYDSALKIFLVRIKKDKDKVVIKKLKIEYFKKLLEKIREKREIINLYEFLTKNNDIIDQSISQFKVIKDFTENRLSELEKIIIRADSIEL